MPGSKQIFTRRIDQYWLIRVRGKDGIRKLDSCSKTKEKPQSRRILSPLLGLTCNHVATMAKTLVGRVKRLPDR